MPSRSNDENKTIRLAQFNDFKPSGWAGTPVTRAAALRKERREREIETMISKDPYPTTNVRGTAGGKEPNRNRKGR